MLLLSIALCVAAAFCYGVRPDACAAVTIFPAWVWAFPGVVLATLGIRPKRMRAAALVGLCWLLYLVFLTEEPASLARGALRSPLHEVGWGPPRASETVLAGGDTLRVVSLNCAGGSLDAAREVGRYQPDVVLLQESPSRREV